MDLIGKVLGNRYEIVEKIGTGGMATVYKARDRVLNRNVAIKILKDEFSNDSEFIKRFQVEAQSAASLSHQNIVSIFDVGNDNGMHYIVMELIEGKTLKEVIEEKGKLSWQDAVKIAAQIAAGLNQAHKNHIVHRDIKPHNIIITRDGVAKVTDFGIAKAVSNSTINAFGTTLGSVHYFSPEHARGGYTDEKSDIYSLGVVLYEMCTGKLPFDAETPVSVALKHLQEVPEEPIKLNPEIPPALNDIILKAMQKEIANRYSSAEALYNDLKRVLKNPDDISLKDVNTSKGEFSTIRIPVVNNKTNDEKINEDMSKNKKEQDDDDMSRKKITKGQALARLFIFILVAIIIFWGCVKGGMLISEKILGTNNTVAVPNIEGYSKEEAEKMLNDLGLQMVVEANIVSEQYPVEGYIVYQEYKEGFKLKPNATVKVRVSKGASKVQVPDITTMHSIEGVKAKLGTLDLNFIEAFETHDTIKSGDIIRQEPVGGTEVEKGSSVVVYFSIGPNSGDVSGDSGLVKVPSVIGLPEADAKKMLDDSKLLAQVSYTSSTVQQDGLVVGQTPEADSYQTELSEIFIVVNKIDKTSNGNNSESGNNTNTSGDSNNNGAVAKRIVTIDLSGQGTRDKFNVKVVIESNVIGGKKIEYEAEHSREDGKIQVPVSDIKGAMLKVYIDDEVQYEMTLS